MKKYIIPEMKLSVFENEDIVTQSGMGSTAFDDAKEVAGNIRGSQHRFTVELDVTF